MNEETGNELRLLIVEDSEDDALLVSQVLESAGFDLVLRRVDTEDDLRQSLDEGEWDLVIQDVALPGLGMNAVIDMIRERDPEMPVIIVSGTIGENAAVEAMRAGVQDYVLKGDGLSRLPPAVEREVRDANHRRERKKAELRIRDLASIVENSADGIISLSRDGTITSWNRGAEDLFGYSRFEMIGKSPLLLAPEDRAGEIDGWIRRALEGISLTGRDSLWTRADGTHVHVSVTVSPVRGEDGGITGVSTVARDITYRKETEAKLRYLADHDPLTNLLNRRRFERELAREIKLAQRFGGTGAVMVLDLDNLKSINDSIGHRAGDQVICRVAELLKKTLREVDIVARIGGDEFAVFIPDGQAELVASRICDEIRELVVRFEDRRFRTTVSIGVAPVTGDQITEGELLVRADLAMYSTKDAGRDSYRVYRDESVDRDRFTNGLNMVERVRTAIEGGAFEVFAQPIFDLELNQIHQYELLVRMKDGNGGMIMPAAFLPTADRFGLIEDVDRWMVTSAIRLLSEINGSEHGTCLSVNLSARSMVNPNLFEMIEREIDEAGVRPENLAFEVTETSVIENMTDARILATRLKDLGCLLALDDFGAGFGSFYYLKHLPFDYLKIDGDFIRRLPANKTDQYMVEAIVFLTGKLGKRTVAEFVEDKDTLDLLVEFGIDFAQGYHIGRPAKVDDGYPRGVALPLPD